MGEMGKMGGREGKENGKWKRILKEMLFKLTACSVWTDEMWPVLGNLTWEEKHFPAG